MRFSLQTRQEVCGCVINSKELHALERLDFPTLDFPNKRYKPKEGKCFQSQRSQDESLTSFCLKTYLDQ